VKVDFCETQSISHLTTYIFIYMCVVCMDPICLASYWVKTQQDGGRVALEQEKFQLGCLLRGVGVMNERVT
jgi:hypothetical protein